jgi:amidophosphoribosyltransferase
MGIDMASREELIASDKTTEDVRDVLEADSLAYLSIDAIAETLDRKRVDLCLGCVTGEYPYDIDGEETDREIERPSVGDSVVEAAGSADDD